MGLSYFQSFVSYFISSARLKFNVDGRSIPLGTSYLSVRCAEDQGFFFLKRTNSISKMILQFRQNNTNEWETIVKVNESGPFLTDISTDTETHLVRNGTCIFGMPGCMIYANISIHLETCVNYLYPSFRCQTFDKTNTVDMSREVQLEITGK